MKHPPTRQETQDDILTQMLRNRGEILLPELDVARAPDEEGKQMARQSWVEDGNIMIRSRSGHEWCWMGAWERLMTLEIKRQKKKGK